jgi:hypothetical protein
MHATPVLKTNWVLHVKALERERGVRTSARVNADTIVTKINRRHGGVEAEGDQAEVRVAYQRLSLHLVMLTLSHFTHPLDRVRLRAVLLAVPCLTRSAVSFTRSAVSYS